MIVESANEGPPQTLAAPDHLRAGAVWHARVGFTIENLDRQLERLGSEGVTILEEIQPFGDTRAAMIADLDGLAIHLIER